MDSVYIVLIIILIGVLLYTQHVESLANNPFLSNLSGSWVVIPNSAPPLFTPYSQSTYTPPGMSMSGYYGSYLKQMDKEKEDPQLREERQRQMYQQNATFATSVPPSFTLTQSGIYYHLVSRYMRAEFQPPQGRSLSLASHLESTPTTRYGKPVQYFISAPGPNNIALTVIVGDSEVTAMYQRA